MNESSPADPKQPFPRSLNILDIGGEGGVTGAWNLNPSSVKTIGPEKGNPIPNHIAGRADAIPLSSNCVRRIVMHRTPLTRVAAQEMRRVIQNDGHVELRHALIPGHDPHQIVLDLFEREGVSVLDYSRHTIDLPTHQLLETRFRIAWGRREPL